MDKTILMDADIHEGSEIDDVADGSHKDLPDLKLFHVRHFLGQGSAGGLKPDVSSWLDELLDDVFQSRFADV